MVEEQNMEQEQAGPQEKQAPSYFGMGANDLAALVQGLMENKDAAKGVIEMFKPVIGEVTDLIMDTLGPEAHKVVLRTMLGNVDIRKQVYDAYLAAEFTPEQAFYLLVMDGGGDKFGKATEAAKSFVPKK